MVSRAILRRAGWLALAVAVLLCFAGIFQHGLWTPDEPREAEIAREMLTSHFSAMPTLGGEPFLEKPPLYAWITAAFYSVFGVNAGAARLPAALFSIGAIVVAYFMGKRAAGRLAGLCAAIVLATMWQFSETSHKAVLDIGLTFFVAAGHLAFLRLKSTTYGSRNAPSGCKDGLIGTEPSRIPTAHSWNRMYVAIGVLTGLAFLTKAWIGPALLCAPPLLAAAAMRDWEYVKRVLPRAFVAAVLGVALLGGPWVMALAATPGGGWAAVKECLVTEYVGRSMGGNEFAKQGHQNPPWYYLTVVFVVVAPWCLALPAMLKGGTLARSWRGGRTLWLALIFVAGVVMLSVPSGKRDLYLLPLMPAMAVPVGAWLSRVGSRRGGAWDVATIRTLSILAGLLISAVFIAFVYLSSAKSLPDAIPAHVREILSAERKSYFFAVVVSASLFLWAGILGFRGRLKRSHRSARAAALLVVLFVLVHVGVFSRLDAFRNMEAGSREIAELVPAGERFIALDADETTLGTVPFHSGRILENIPSPSDAERVAGAPSAAAKALARFDSGDIKHLVVMDKDVGKLGPELKRRLALVKTVRLSATRDVNVYVLKP